MRSLTLLPWTPLFVAVAVLGCTKDNPAFDDCESPDQCVSDESGTSLGDGDGESGDGDGDGGDGESDTEAGDGDGDGDEETGDGDGEPDPNMLPPCPETKTLELPIVKDTFLVAAPEQGSTCVVGWDFELWQPKLANTQLPCEELTFGATPLHWVCASPECQSLWLGRFNVGGFADQAPKVISAQVELMAQIDNGEGNQVTLYPLELDMNVFGQCGDWSPGGDWGEPVTECKTTWKYSAHPNVWQIDGLLNNVAALGAAPVPAGELFEHEIIIPIANAVAQGWLLNDPLHLGVLLRSQAWLPTEFMIHAQESEKPPRLVLEVCSEL